MLLQTTDLTKDYRDVRALDHLSLEIRPGEIVGLLGPNGSGKSTALRLILGFIKPTRGTATVNGHDCWRDSVAARRHISYLPGELRLYENMSGQQLIRFLCDLRDVKPVDAYRKLAASFEIDLTRPLKHMSSGMKRKAALLAVLSPHAPLLIMDEPTNTLDPTMRDILLDQLRDAKKNGQAVLFSSHVLVEAEHLCDRVGILKNGKLVHLQPIDEIVRSRRIVVRFEEPTEGQPNIAGLKCQERTETSVVWDYAGDLAPLLQWLAQRPVSDVHIEPQGLAPIYHQYHGTDANAC